MPNVLESTANDITAAEKTILQGIAWAEAEHLGTLLGVPINRLAAILQIAPATMQRRKTAGRFPVDESERIVRFARIWFWLARLWEVQPVRGLGFFVSSMGLVDAFLLTWLAWRSAPAAWKAFCTVSITEFWLNA